MKKETSRCLGCGSTVVDEFMCVGCGQCTVQCKFGAISLVKRYEGEGCTIKDFKRRVVPHVLKRKVKIAARELKEKIHA